MAPAGGAGRNGNVPPVEHQFKPGQSGNPAGRPPNVGLSLQEHLNALDADEAVGEPELWAISRDAKARPSRRAAAIRLLRMVEVGDLADFTPLLKGQKTLDELRAAGVNTSIVKKVKPCEFGVEIELHDRGGEEFDRVADRTNGKPKQTVDATVRTAEPVEVVFPPTAAAGGADDAAD